jgi:hypothetical protein
MNHSFSVSKVHYLCYISTDATSVTSTMLRLISSYEESDGRCVHILGKLFMIEFFNHYSQVHLQNIFNLFIRVYI